MAKTKTVPPPKHQTATIETDPQKEFVAGVLDASFVPGERGLPQSIDDAEREFGDDIYPRMMNDATLAGSIGQLVAKILEDGVTIAPSHEEPAETEVDPTAKSDYERAKANADMVRRALKNLSLTGLPFIVVLEDMIRGALIGGHKFAEPVYKIVGAGPDKGKLLVHTLKVKPKKNYVFIVDEFSTFIGIQAIVPGHNLTLRRGLLPSVEGVDNIVSKERCFVLSFGNRDNGPKGTSLLRPAYDPWKRKQIFKPEEVKFIGQFGGGLITVVLGKETPATIAIKKADGSTEQVSTYEGVGRITKQLANGGYGIYPQDVQIQVNVPDADGKAFDGAYDRANKEMVMAVLTSARTLMESNRNSQADAGSAENLLDTIVSFFREVVCEAIQSCLIYYMVQKNQGEEDAREYLPRAVMAKTAKPDFAKNATAVSSLYSSGAMTDEMLPDAHREHLGLKWKGQLKKDDGQEANQDDQQDQSNPEKK